MQAAWWQPLLLVLIASVEIRGKFLYLAGGERCNADDWYCKMGPECGPRNETKHLDICSMVGWERIVCCPPVRKLKPNITKSEAMCDYYKDFVYGKAPTLSLSAAKIDQCGWDPRELVVGGVNAQLKEFPHMVLLGYGNKDRRGRVRQWGCGGSLISERFVLSAAHCLRPKGATSEVRWANVGDLNIRQSQAVDGAPGLVVEIVERYIHPGFRNDLKYNDIALFKVHLDLRFSPYMRPACLPSALQAHDLAAKYIATGWGKTGPEIEDWNPNLQKVDLKHVEAAECNKSYAGFPQLPNGINMTSMICAGGMDGKDTCYGDSGGPIQIKLSRPYCMYSLVGVTSFGKEGRCGTSGPSVYTRVSAFVPWIEAIVWPQ